MYPKDALSTLISELSGRIPPPVHTAGIEEDRPVPAVIVQNIDIDNKNHHNSNYAGSEYDSQGSETTQYFRHYYSLTLTLVVRDSDEVDAYDNLGKLQAALSTLARDPVNRLHGDVHEIRLLGSGPVSYQYYEPTETELTQTVVLETFYESEESNLDPISGIHDSIDNS